MARRKADLTQDELNDLAERAQDLAIELSAAAERYSLMAPLKGVEPAAKLNQLIETAGHMNRVLLAHLSLAALKAEIETKPPVNVRSTFEGKGPTGYDFRIYDNPLDLDEASVLFVCENDSDFWCIADIRQSPVVKDYKENVALKWVPAVRTSRVVVD